MPLCHSTSLFMFVVIFCGQTAPSSSPDKDPSVLTVMYSRNPVRRTERQILTLKCTVVYQKEQCGALVASWNLRKEHLLTDRYLIQVNETIEAGFRRRNIFMTFMQLTVNDSGFYHCTAECQNGRTAVGHHINVTITAEEQKSGSVQCHAGVVLLILSGLFLPLSL